MGVVVNLTRHLVGYTIGHDTAGFWQVTVAVKSTYTWDKDRRVHPVEPSSFIEARPPADDEPESSPPPVDLGPIKPRVDVLLVGALTFAAPIDKVDVALSVGTRLRKVARVFGDRYWLPGVIDDLAASRPAPTTSIPIGWERCFGGSDRHTVEPRNPIGTGIAREASSLERRLLPNFEDPTAAITSWKSRPRPTGFGAVAAHWQPRVTLAGTYDEAWKRTRWPLLPVDFDSAFFNLAPADQQLDGYQAGEEVRLDHMTTADRDRFELPAFEPAVTITTSDDLIEDVATVDTIVIEPSEHRFSLVARAAARLHPGVASLRRIVVGASPASAAPGSGRAQIEGAG